MQNGKTESNAQLQNAKAERNNVACFKHFIDLNKVIFSYILLERLGGDCGAQLLPLPQETRLHMHKRSLVEHLTIIHSLLTVCVSLLSVEIYFSKQAHSNVQSKEVIAKQQLFFLWQNAQCWYGSSKWKCVTGIKNYPKNTL